MFIFLGVFPIIPTEPKFAVFGGETEAAVKSELVW